jgi:hypothetical protein
LSLPLQQEFPARSEPGIAVDELLDVVHLPGEERRLEDLVHLHVADAGSRTHLIGQVALVPAGVAHHGLHDLDADLEFWRENVKFPERTL